MRGLERGIDQLMRETVERVIRPIERGGDVLKAARNTGRLDTAPSSVAARL